jgi:acyl-coenzyme A thioesterase PaaI-like protein
MTTSIATSAGMAGIFQEIDPGKPDYERMIELAADLVPFGSFTGVRVTELGPDEAVAEIPDEPHLRNHLGTVHAGALFLAADIAGAAAFISASVTKLASLQFFTLRDAVTSFRKPATGRIRAVAAMDPRGMRAILAATGDERLEVDGKALLYNADGVLVGKANFGYVCQLAGAQAGQGA